ncbi:MAG: ketoacyl-ACP synthase III [Alistipes sp.]
MSYISTHTVAIRGVAACVPKKSEENISSAVFTSEDEAQKFIASTGIERRRVADAKTTASDLCCSSAEKLIQDLDWGKDSIDCLIFVSQTPDYILPATSCILQNRLGLSEECYTIDISLGCSGWVYGLSVITNLLASGEFKRGLLLVGDTILKLNSPRDKSAWPLFGDAGTATALEYDIDTDPIMFHFATDGAGAKAIIVPEGGYRMPYSPDALTYELVEQGISRNKMHCILNGMDVFTFGISKAPKSVNQLIEHFDLDKESVDYFVMHQANLFMNEKIRKKLKFDTDKVLYSLKDFGNTSCASIPLTMVSNSIFEGGGTQTILGCGFGVGLSWGSVYFQTQNIVCPKLIEI